MLHNHHNHNHIHTIKYCDQCDVCYCSTCGQEWTRSFVSIPSVTVSGGWTPKWAGTTYTAHNHA